MSIFCQKHIVIQQVASFEKVMDIFLMVIWFLDQFSINGENIHSNLKVENQFTK